MAISRSLARGDGRGRGPRAGPTFGRDATLLSVYEDGAPTFIIGGKTDREVIARK